MPSVRTLRAEGAASAAAEPQVASWYTQGRSDSLGDRLLMFDNTNAASLELLRFRSALAAREEFEVALRERVKRLGRFEHPAFPTVRAVEHLEDRGGLALVSTHVPGRRLSEMFHGPQPRAGLHPAFVTWLIRQLTGALAALQAEGHDVFHGAMSADRVIVSAEGQLLIAEHVLGSALQGLRLTPTRLSHEFGIIAPASRVGVAQLDARTDVIQLGLTALSVLLGRPIVLEAYQNDLRPLLDEFSGIAKQRSPFLAPPLLLWLERALQQANYGFRSAAEARDGLRELPETTSPRGFTAVQPTVPKPRTEAAAHTPSAGVRSESASPTPATTAGPATAARPATATGSVSTAGPAVAAGPAPTAGPPPADRPGMSRDFLGQQAQAHKRELFDPYADRRRRGAGWTVTLGVIALLEAGIIGRLLLASPSPAPATTASHVLVESPRAGDLVIVDGQQAGTTPLSVPLGTEIKSIRVVPGETQAAPSPPPVEPRAAVGGRDVGGRDAVRPAGSLPAQAAARPRAGGVRLVSPIDLQVFERGRFLGSSATGPIMAAAGIHDLELANDELGYRTSQRVVIAEGQIVPLTITPPLGRLSINAVPWAQVWLDGRPVGETPLSELPASVGEHTITFRHPELGERRETVTVRPGAETRVSATLRQ